MTIKKNCGCGASPAHPADLHWWIGKPCFQLRDPAKVSGNRLFVGAQKHTMRYHLPMTAEQSQDPTLYQLIGGDAQLRELVDRFYDLMDLEPEFAGIRAMHPTPLDSSRDKLYWFLCGWTGGPDLYIERFGHPRLRARHMPYAIASDERDQWLRCMGYAMHELGIEQSLQERLMHAFYQTADWMRNTEG